MSFAVTPGRSVAVDRDRHRLERTAAAASGWPCTCSTSDVPMPKAMRAERAVRGGVAVAADHGHPGLGQAELRADDVHDALLGVTHRVQPDTELLAVAAKGVDLGARDRIGDGELDVDGRDVVVLGRDGEVGAAQRPPGQPEAVEGLRAGHFVQQVEVDVEQVRFGAFALGARGGFPTPSPPACGPCRSGWSSPAPSTVRRRNSGAHLRNRMRAAKEGRSSSSGFSQMLDFPKCGTLVSGRGTA